MRKYSVFIITFMLFVTLSAKNYSIDNWQNEEYAAFAEQMPQPIGGLEGIYKLIEYPKMAQNAGVQGKVYLLAYINENGGVDDVKVIKGIGAGCEEAAIEAVKQTKFTPGSSGGKNIKVKLSLQFQFKLG